MKESMVYQCPKDTPLTVKQIKNLVMIFIPPPNEVGGGVYWIHLVAFSIIFNTENTEMAFIVDIIHA